MARALHALRRMLGVSTLYLQLQHKVCKHARNKQQIFITGAGGAANAWVDQSDGTSQAGSLSPDCPRVYQTLHAHM